MHGVSRDSRIDSPFTMMVELVDALIAITTMSTTLVDMKLAEKTEGLVLRRSRRAFTLKKSVRIPAHEDTTRAKST